MVDTRLLSKLRSLAGRRRWIIGLAASGQYRSLTATLVAADGAGLGSRLEVLAHRRAALPPAHARWFRRLRTGAPISAADPALLAAALAEQQAALLDEFSADVAPVWDRVAAVAVDGAGLWRQVRGMRGRVELCDAARLADMSGLNVIDGFAGRDLAQEGSGRALLTVPLWMLLHDLQRTRVCVQVGRRVRLTYLPASRDATGASRVSRTTLAGPADGVPLAQTIAAAIARFPATPAADEIILCGPADRADTLCEPLAACLPGLQVRRVAELGIDAAALKSAAVAVLGLLHLDQTPGNCPAITAARARACWADSRPVHWPTGIACSASWPPAPPASSRSAAPSSARTRHPFRSQPSSTPTVLNCRVPCSRSREHASQTYTPHPGMFT